MVEGPKVSLKQERLHPRLTGQRLETMTTTMALKKDDNNSCNVVGTIVAAVEAVGKELFVVFAECKHALRIHFGMDGVERIVTRQPGDVIPTSTEACASLAATLLPSYSRKKFSCALVFENVILILFDSTLTIKTAAYVEKQRGLCPRDVMASAFDADTVVALLQQETTRAIQDAVMDQILLPGVGNVIKCEALFTCGIHIHAVPSQLPQVSLTASFPFLIV